jgi:diacylglycerol O-acyltransferase / wax synthase
MRRTTDGLDESDGRFVPAYRGSDEPMHVGGVSIFEGPAPQFEQLEEMVAGKLGLVPRYRQKVRFVPLGLGHPVWVDDPHFNLSYHLRRTALPAPGNDDQLRRTAARIFAQHLDRNKPLWEIWMVEGLSESRWALLSKVHHCMVDGVSATDLMSARHSQQASAAGPSTRRDHADGASVSARTVVGARAPTHGGPRRSGAQRRRTAGPPDRRSRARRPRMPSPTPGQNPDG